MTTTTKTAYYVAGCEGGSPTSRGFANLSYLLRWSTAEARDAWLHARQDDDQSLHVPADPAIFGGHKNAKDMDAAERGDWS